MGLSKREEGGETYSFVCIFDERETAWFSFQGSSFVEEKVNIGDFAKFREDLY